MHHLTNAHWTEVKRILLYLSSTQSMGLHFRCCPDISLNVYCDTDLGGNKQDRKSTIGFAIFASPNLIFWSSKNQQVVFRSSIESEYHALATTTSELLWLLSLLKEIGFSPPQPPRLWCDNIGATYLTSSPIFHTRSCHLEIEFHFVRDPVAKK